MNRRLEISALQTLCAVQDHGGVTRASEHLSLSQSAVSHKIKRLESSIDCELLSRRAGAPALTAEGERLVAYARRILALHDEALLSLGKRSLSGKIRLGMTEDTTSSDLSRILGRFTRLHPNISVRTHVRQSLMLERELEHARVANGHRVGTSTHRIHSPLEMPWFQERRHALVSEPDPACACLAIDPPTRTRRQPPFRWTDPK